MASFTLCPVPRLGILPQGGMLLYTYAAGTTTQIATYTDSTGGTANTNPLQADGAGLFSAIYLQAGQSYKFVVQNSSGVGIFTQDGISATPGTAAGTDWPGVAGESIAATATAYLSDGSGGLNAGQWYNASSSNPYSSSTAGIVGIALTALSGGATGTFRINGGLSGMSASLAAGTSYYVAAAPGTLTSTAPANSRFVGEADGPNSIIIAPNPQSSAVSSVSGTAGESLSAGNAVYLSDGSGSKTLGRWYNGDNANAYSSSRAVQVGFALAAIGSGSTGQIMVVGRPTVLSGLTTGAAQYIGTAGALTATRPNNARLMGIADSTTSLVIQDAPLAAAVPLFATLANVSNTAAETTILSFVVPANSWADGDAIHIWMANLNKNNKGSGGTALGKINAGAGGQVSLTNGGLNGSTAWADGATEYKSMGFAVELTRVGADVWVNSQLTGALSGGVSVQPFGGPPLTGAIIDGFSTPNNFTTDFTVSLKVTLSAADATFYIKPQAARIWQQVKG